MLPPAHVSAGYVTTAALFYFRPEMDNQFWLSATGVFFGALPDVDFVASRLSSNPEMRRDHRRFCTHSPITWLPLLLVFFLAPISEYQDAALVAFCGAISHLVLDSIDYGCMWLWPWKKEFYCLFNKGVYRTIPPERKEGEGIVTYVLVFFREYYWDSIWGRHRVCTICEIMITLAGPVVVLLQ